MKIFLLPICLIWALLSPAFAEDNMYSETDNSGFVGIEGGVWYLLGQGRNTVEDPVVLYLTTGFSLTKAFYAAEDYEPLKIGPKIGIGFGTPRGGAASYESFYDLLMKVRYTFGSEATRLRPYIDAGPGFITFREKAFEMEMGSGVEYLLGSGSFGLNVQYKEVVGNSQFKRGLTFLASLTFHF